jgi:hypothetical protein
MVTADCGRRVDTPCSAEVSQIGTENTELAWLVRRMVRVLQRMDEQAALDQQQHQHQQ